MYDDFGLFLCARQRTCGASGEIQPGGGREKKAGDRTQNPASQSENILFLTIFLSRPKAEQAVCPLFQLLNQSSASVSHKDIAARQAGSSIFPWQQQEHSLGRQSHDAMETPLKRRGTSLWDSHEETPIKPSQRMSSSRVAPSPSGASQQTEQLKSINQG